MRIIGLLRPLRVLGLLVSIFVSSCSFNKTIVAQRKENEVSKITIARLRADSTNLAEQIAVLKKQNSINTESVKEVEKSRIVKEKKETAHSYLPVDQNNNTAVALSKEEELNSKTVFIYNLCKYIYNPRFSAKPEYTIAVIGSYALYLKIESYFKGKMINQQSIKINYVLSPAKLTETQAIVVASKETKSLESIKKKAAKYHCLIFTETDTRPNACNCINLYVAGAKVKYDMNQYTLKKNGFQINQSLLQLEN